MDTKPYMQDRAAAEFFACLERDEFKTTRCSACGETHYPPRVVCPHCLGEDMEWVDLPRQGTLIAFTQQTDAIRCRMPDVLGLVELDGVGNLFTRIDAPFEELSIGMKVAFGTWTSLDGVLLHQFTPTD
jgi:uncharacterized OB-fold protein